MWDKYEKLKKSVIKKNLNSKDYEKEMIKTEEALCTAISK